MGMNANGFYQPAAPARVVFGTRRAGKNVLPTTGESRQANGVRTSIPKLHTVNRTAAVITDPYAAQSVNLF